MLSDYLEINRNVMLEYCRTFLKVDPDIMYSLYAA